MGLFFNASSITELDVSKWDVSNVQRMEYMFSDMHSLTHLDVSNWNTSNVKNVAYMFSTLTSLKELNVGNWNTTNVSNMMGVFSDSTKLQMLNIKNWDTTNVVLMDNMFKGLESLKKITIGDKLANSSLTGNLFEGLDNIEGIRDEHYNQTWERALNENGDLSDEKTTVYHVDEDVTSNYSKYWNEEYRKNPIELAGTYVRDKDSHSIKYYSKETDETIEYKRFTDDKKDYNKAILEYSNNVIPKTDYQGYKFGGWLVRAQSPEWNGTNEQIVLLPIEKVFNNNINNEYWHGAIPDGSLDKEKSMFNITFYAKWEKVENITTQRKPIEPTTVYKADNNLDKGNRTEEEGQVGEKEIVTTYKTTPITGELTDPTTTENVITPMRPKVVKVGTKPTEIEKQIDLPIIEKQIDNLVKGKEKITQGSPRIEKEITEYTVNETTGDITESKRIEVVDEGTPTIKEIGTRNSINKIVNEQGKELTPEELVDYTEPNYDSPDGTTAEGDPIYNVRRITTTYKSDDNLEKGKQEVEKDGKSDGNKVIKVGTKPTVVVETLPSSVKYEKDDSREKGQENITVKGKDGTKTTTTTYTINPETGEVIPHIEEPVIVNPTTTIIKVAAKNKVEIVNKKDGTVVKETTSYTINEKTGEITESKHEEVIKNKTETSKGEPEILDTPKEFTGGVNPNDAPIVEELPELKVAVIKDNKGSILEVIKENETPKEIDGYKNTGKTEIDKDGYKVYIYEKIETQKPITKEKQLDTIQNNKEDNLKENNETIKKKEELPKTSSSMLATFGLFGAFGIRKNRKKNK